MTDKEASYTGTEMPYMTVDKEATYTLYGRQESHLHWEEMPYMAADKEATYNGNEMPYMTDKEATYTGKEMHYMAEWEPVTLGRRCLI